MTSRTLAALFVVAALGACNSGSYRAVLVYPADAEFDRAATVELFVGEQMGCAELKQQNTLPRLVFDAHGDAPTLGRVEFGRIAVLAKVRDTSCTIFLAGCAEAVVEARSDVMLRIPLEASSGGGCRSGERCIQARCVVADAGAGDAAQPDTAQPDATRPDAAQPDAVQPDAAQPDAALPADITSNLLGRWTFDENTGSVAHDSSGNNRDGTISGATWTTGHSGSALSFDGNGDSVIVPSTTALDLRGAMTLAVWILSTGQQATWARVIDHDYNSSYSLSFGDGVDDLEFWLDGQKIVDSGDGVIAHDVWKHAVLTYQTSGATTLYIDGVAVASATHPGAITGAASNLYFGSAAGYDFAGRLDGIRVYDRALSADDVAALFAAGD